MSSKNEILLLSILDMEIHEKIRIIRQSKSYTQENVADSLNIDTVNYGRIERGKAKLTVDRLFEICKILDTEPASLFQDNFHEKTETALLCEKIFKEVKEINEKLT